MADSHQTIDWDAVRKTGSDCLDAAWSLVCFAERTQESEYDADRAAAHLEAIDRARDTFRLAIEVLQPGLECATDDSIRHSPVFDALALATAGRSDRPDFRYGPVCSATAHEAAFELLRWAILWVENGLNAELDERGLPDQYVAGIDDLHQLAPADLRDALVRLERKAPLRRLLGGRECRQIRAWINHEWAALSNIAGKPAAGGVDAQKLPLDRTKAELAARFDRVLSALRAVIAAETALEPAWEQSLKGVRGAFGDALFSRSMAHMAFEEETPTMDALTINLKDNHYKDPTWPTDGADDIRTLRTVWHFIYDTTKAGKSFDPDGLNAMRTLDAALERAREILTEPQPLAVGGNDEKKPSWDRIEAELRFDGEVVKTIRRIGIAKNVVGVLDAFQEEHWPGRVDSPLPPSGSQQHHATIRSLNQGLSRIRFRSDGEGKGFIWETV